MTNLVPTQIPLLSRTGSMARINTHPTLFCMPTLFEVLHYSLGAIIDISALCVRLGNPDPVSTLYAIVGLFPAVARVSTTFASFLLMSSVECLG